MKKEDLVLVGVGVAVVAVWYMKQGASALVDGVSSAANAINPLKNNNIINQGATSAYQYVTGSKGSIGGDVYDFLHPTPVAPDSSIKTTINVIGTPGYDKYSTATDSQGNAVAPAMTNSSGYD